MAERRLTEKQEGFAKSVIIDGCSYAEAYRRNYNYVGMSEINVWKEASALADNPAVAGRIDELRKIRDMAAYSELSMNVRKLMDTYIAISFVDPNELISVKSGCCRHCHGVGGGYQWREREYFAELAKWERHPNKMAMPEIGGGFGFRMWADPNPDCEECHGEGVERVVPRDTTKLSPGAKLLYQGAQQTKDGIKINFADKVKTLEMIGRMLGAFDDKLRVDLSGQMQNLQLTTDDPGEASRIYQAMLSGKIDKAGE